MFYKSILKRNYIKQEYLGIEEIKNWNFSSSQIKTKYNKKLLIYDKVDSNYNYMNMNISEAEKVILIKSFLLSEDGITFQPSMKSLDNNTIDVN